MSAVFPFHLTIQFLGIDHQNHFFRVIVLKIRDYHIIGIKIRTMHKTAFIKTLFAIISCFDLILIFGSVCSMHNYHISSLSFIEYRSR